RHCPGCGSVLEAEMAGWVLRCREEGTEHFPRTDPAVIMAVRDGGDRLLLARNAHFPSRFHSVLAGFVEPGESLENAVAREVAEEVGVEVEAVEYVGSQPWPFPRSLMLGFRAWAPGAGELTLQEEEIAEARWFTREELAAALEAEEIALPGAASMGRALIDDWCGDLGARWPLGAARRRSGGGGVRHPPSTAARDSSHRPGRMNGDDRPCRPHRCRPVRPLRARGRRVAARRPRPRAARGGP